MKGDSKPLMRHKIYFHGRAIENAAVPVAEQQIKGRSCRKVTLTDVAVRDVVEFQPEYQTERRFAERRWRRFAEKEGAQRARVEGSEKHAAKR